MMRATMLTSVLILLSACCIARGFHSTGNMRYRIEMSVFSGRQNPSWTVDRRHPLYMRLKAGLSRVRPTRMDDDLGYGGFSITMRNVEGERAYKTIGAGTYPALEMLLLRSSPSRIEPLVRRHVIAKIRGRILYPHSHIYQMKRKFQRARRSESSCTHPRFDPENWNVPPVLSRNNCYNYATQRQTNTFAQPGRTDDMMITRPFHPRAVLEATFEDGLVRLPFFSPKMFPQFCYIALVIWPGVDFHFYRLDDDMHWSHKPGSTLAKNTDNSGDLIADPKTADRGDYVVFAGYLGNHPSVRVI